jgi:hypothetical protein
MAGQLAVTELMYAAAPAVGGSDYDYIEFQNIGDAPLPLGGLMFTQGLTYAFPTQDLAPGQFIILAKNIDVFRSRYGNLATVIGPYAGQLDNAGEALTISRNGVGVLSFEYSPNWYPQTNTQGFSLVPVNPLATTPTPSERAYWRPSSAMFGSPGFADPSSLTPNSVVINEVLAHTDLPLGDWIELKNTTAQSIDIGGWFLSDNNSDLKKYKIPAGTMIPAGGFVTFTQFAQFDNPTNARVPFGLSELGDETLYLTAADAQENILGYQVQQSILASDREVTMGRYVKSSGGTDFTFLQIASFGAENAPPLVFPAVINELLYAPTDPADEFIEIRNLSAQTLNLFHSVATQNTWKLGGGVEFTFPAGASIPANGLALVTLSDPNAFRAKFSIPVSIPIFGPYTGLLSNQGEEIELLRPGDPETTGEVPYYRVDRVNYSTDAPWPDGTDQGGVSLAKLGPTTYGNDGANWGPGPVGGTPGAANATIVTVSINNTTVTEQNGNVTATLTVTLSSAAAEVVTVNFSTFDGTALAAEDYEAKSGQVTFQPGQTQQTIDVVVLGDLNQEDNEEFTVILNNPVNATLGDASGRVTIDNDDSAALPAISVGDVSVAEGNAGTSVITFVLQLSASSTDTVTVDIQTADASALAGEDYIALTQTLTFPPGTTTLNATVTINGDVTVEPTEKFLLNLSNPTAATISDAQAAGRIFSDDPVAAPWQNAALPRDVDDDGAVDNDDANAILAQLNANGAGVLPPPTIDVVPPYLDVNGNNRITGLDALIVLNFLNRNLAGQSSLRAASDEIDSLVGDIAASRHVASSPAPLDLILAAGLWSGENGSGRHLPTSPPAARIAANADPTDERLAPQTADPPAVSAAIARSDAGDALVLDRSYVASCLAVDAALEQRDGEPHASRHAGSIQPDAFGHPSKFRRARMSRGPNLI